MATLEELEARLALLEARVPIAPLAANPPIAMGELLDVPAPGSPIVSPWAQEVSGRILHRFPSIAAMKAWAAPAGSIAIVVGVALVEQRIWVRYGNAWNSYSIGTVQVTTDVNGFVNPFWTAAQFGFTSFTSAAVVAHRDGATATGYTVYPVMAAGSIQLYTLQFAHGQGVILANTKTFMVSWALWGTA